MQKKPCKSHVTFASFFAASSITLNSISPLPLHIQSVIKTLYLLKNSWFHLYLPWSHYLWTGLLPKPPKGSASIFIYFFPSHLFSVISPECSYKNVNPIMLYPCLKLFKGLSLFLDKCKTPQQGPQSTQWSSYLTAHWNRSENFNKNSDA